MGAVMQLLSVYHVEQKTAMDTFPANPKICGGVVEEGGFWGGNWV
jgi:hypothetical protein